MTTKGTPSSKFPYKSSPKERKKSYAVRLAAQFGDKKAKERLYAYNRAKKERRAAVVGEGWFIEGREFSRYQVMEYIVTRVSEGESLPGVCAQRGFPTMQTVYSWFDHHPDFEKAYNRAEEIRAHRIGEEARRIAEGTDRENVQADKLKVETLLKFAARGNKRFQDKVQVQSVDEFDKMTPDQIRQRIQAMLAADPSLIHSLSGVPQAALGTVAPVQSSPLQEADLVQTDTPDGDAG